LRHRVYNSVTARILLLLLAAAPCAASEATDHQLPATGDVVARGAYLTAASGCVSCHTDKENDGAPFAGGHALETPYGVFYTPNITPDMETGIGGWSDSEFSAAVREGVAPDGSHYYPSFPYPSYAGMTDDDVLAIKAYLDSLTPVRQPYRPNQLRWFVPGRGTLGAWKKLNAPWSYDPPKPGTERGAYLVRHLGHCGECHTRRGLGGGLKLDEELAGSPKSDSNKGAPAIDNSESGLADWELSDIEFFLELGMTPDGDFTGGDMAAVIEDNTSQLTADDRAAIALYLKSLN